jgi:hypothetical protein
MGGDGGFLLLTLCVVSACWFRLFADTPKPNGGTALYDSTFDCIQDIQSLFRNKAEMQALQLDNDMHKYLIVLTDGEDMG